MWDPSWPHGRVSVRFLVVADFGLGSECSSDRLNCGRVDVMQLLALAADGPTPALMNTAEHGSLCAGVQRALQGRTWYVEGGIWFKTLTAADLKGPRIHIKREHHWCPLINVPTFMPCTNTEALGQQVHMRVCLAAHIEFPT